MEFFAAGLREAWSAIVRGDPELLHAVWVSLSCSVTAILLAGAIGVPYGAWLGLYRKQARFEISALRTATAVPTVILGLLVYGLLSRRGLLGGLDLLYTRTAIVVGEFLLALPLLGTLSHGIAASLPPRVVESALTLGASRWQALRRALGEQRPALAGAVLATFGRCVTELGIAISVGGNLMLETRTLPTTIALELSRGDFGRALAPGLVLLALAGLATLLTHVLSREDAR